MGATVAASVCAISNNPKTSAAPPSASTQIASRAVLTSSMVNASTATTIDPATGTAEPSVQASSDRPKTPIPRRREAAASNTRAVTGRSANSMIR